MVSVKEALEEVARKTMARLEASESLEIRFGEETLTDLVLLELKQANCPSIQIIQTSKALEASQGTDWEWWIGSDATGWLRLAIQAKKLGPSTKRYDQLNHKVGGTAQIDLLESYAASTGAIPLYCLFNRVTPSEATAGWRCCEVPSDHPQVSCTLVAASTIRKAIKTRGARTFKAVHAERRSVPWRCIQCPTKGARAVLGNPKTPPPQRAAWAREVFGEPAIIYENLPADIRQARQTGRLEFGYVSPEGRDHRTDPEYIAVIELDANGG